MAEVRQYDGFEVWLNDSGVRFIRVNRPHKKNALTLDMYRSFADAMADAAADDSTRDRFYDTPLRSKCFRTNFSLSTADYYIHYYITLFQPKNI
jgi:hypothetical protein